MVCLGLKIWRIDIKFLGVTEDPRANNTFMEGSCSSGGGGAQPGAGVG